MGHLDVKCSEKDYLVSYFGYEDRSSTVYWNMHVRAEW